VDLFGEKAVNKIMMNIPGMHFYINIPSFSRTVKISRPRWPNAGRLESVPYWGFTYGYEYRRKGWRKLG
jgi:hypothetical protein